MAKLASESNVISHWHHPIQNFDTSPLDFYAAVERTLQPAQIPDATISRVDWKEGGALSSRREYLRVSRGRVAFDICAAPFGTGFFFSWWLAELPLAFGPIIAVGLFILMFVICAWLIDSLGFSAGIVASIIIIPFAAWLIGFFIRQDNPPWEDALLQIPYFGPLYERIFKPVTYYKLDTALMFQSAVHSAVLEAIDQLLSSKGVRALTELERKPIMQAFYER